MFTMNAWPSLYLLVMSVWHPSTLPSRIRQSLYKVVVGGGGGGYIGFTPSVHPSVCPASCVPSVAPTVLVGSILYLCILSSNFRRCVACKVSCKISKFAFLAIFLKILTLTLSCFDLGSWCESLEWVIMGWWGISQSACVLVVLVLTSFPISLSLKSPPRDSIGYFWVMQHNIIEKSCQHFAYCWWSSNVVSATVMTVL